jgi:hypothetical protein
MHRTQIKKKKKRFKDLKRKYLFLFLLFSLFSQLHVWEEMWVQTGKPVIPQ